MRPPSSSKPRSPTTDAIQLQGWRTRRRRSCRARRPRQGWRRRVGDLFRRPGARTARPPVPVCRPRVPRGLGHRTAWVRLGPGAPSTGRFRHRPGTARPGCSASCLAARSIPSARTGACRRPSAGRASRCAGGARSPACVPPVRGPRWRAHPPGGTAAARARHRLDNPQTRPRICD